MKIKELLYKTPEMTEEKLMELIKEHKEFLAARRLQIIPRLQEIYGFFSDDEFPKIIINEWELIQEKKSYLTKAQRNCILGLVSVCLIKMTKGNGE